MKIGITGCNGFIGKALSCQLRLEKIQITFFDRKNNNLLHPDTMKDFISSCDVIIHLAGFNRDSMITEMIKVNVGGTMGLLLAIKKYNPKVKLIFASSFMVYIKNDIFGATKKVAEEIIEEYSRELPMKAIILRFSNIYGEGGKPFRNSVLSTFSHEINKGEKLKISGDGSQKRDFLYIGDAVNAIIKSINYNPKKIQYFDICTSQLTSLNEVVNMFSLLKKNNIDVSYGDFFQNHEYKIKKGYLFAKEKLGWKPKVSLLEGIKKLI